METFVVIPWLDNRLTGIVGRRATMLDLTGKLQRRIETSVFDPSPISSPSSTKSACAR